MLNKAICMKIHEIIYFIFTLLITHYEFYQGNPTLLLIASVDLITCFTLMCNMLKTQ